MVSMREANILWGMSVPRRLEDLEVSFYLQSWKEVTILCDLPSRKTQNIF